MPPRISPHRGVPGRGRNTSRGGHPGGANRGSQLGGPSSIETNSAATPPEISDIPHVNIPSAIGGRPSGNHGRGRGRGRGRGSSHAVPASPPLASNTSVQVIDAETTTITSPSIYQSIPTQIPASIANDPAVFRGQPSGNHGRIRGRGRGSSHAVPPLASNTSVQVIDAETATITSPSIYQSIPTQIPAPIANDPAVFRGQPSGNRGRGAGRGGVPDRHPSTAISPAVTASTISETTSIASVSQSRAAQIPISSQVNPPITPSSTFSGQGRNRGRGRGRGASRGGGPGAPSTPATPITGETAPHSVIRGQPFFSGRGGYRGSARPSSFDSPSPFSGYSSPGSGGPSGAFVAGIPGKLYYSTNCVYLTSFFINPR
jgi:hypothetical protein